MPLRRVQGPVPRWTAAGLILALACAAAPARPAVAADSPVSIVAFGDSLMAGYGLRGEAAFPERLQQALSARGEAVEIANAGVSGDTAADGLARLDWSVPDGTGGVILELGANDALRGIDPKLTRQALDAIIRRLQARHIQILLCGMKAPRNLGAEYDQAFDAIFPDLANRYGLVFYPFFLDGVATVASLNQNDGMHPTAAGIDVIVKAVMPKVDELIARVRRQS